jgi:chromosome segregation ATPase
VLTVLFVTSLAAPAQETDTDLLRAILCELKVLRTTVHEGQVFVPLVEANAGERLQIQERISELEQKRSDLDQGVQESIAQQAKIRELLRQLSRVGRNDHNEESAERQKQDLETELKATTQQLQVKQSQHARLSTEVLREQSRLTQLKDELDQMQRQMRDLEARSAALCTSTARDQ